MDSVITICYKQKKIWFDRAEAIAFFEQGVRECEGSERERYQQICDQLRSGAKEATDEEKH